MTLRAPVAPHDSPVCKPRQRVRLNDERDTTIAKQNDTESWHCTYPMLHGGPTRNRTTHSMDAQALGVCMQLDNDCGLTRGLGPSCPPDGDNAGPTRKRLPQGGTYPFPCRCHRVAFRPRCHRMTLREAAENPALTCGLDPTCPPRWRRRWAYPQEDTLGRDASFSLPVSPYDSPGTGATG